MPTFTYTARSSNGDLRSATIDAPSRVTMRFNSSAGSASPSSRWTRRRANAKKASGKGIKMRDIVIFTRQFSTMINAGLPLVQALDILAKQSENKALPTSCATWCSTWSAATRWPTRCASIPKAFSDLYTNMVAAGEAGGILDTILNAPRGVHGEERQARSQGEGRHDLPGGDHVRGGACVVILLWKVIPVFEGMFGQVGMELPLPTKIVIGMSAFLNAYWWALIAGTGASAFLIQEYYATTMGSW